MGTATEEQTQTADRTVIIEPWNVILFNDDSHSFDEVIVQLMSALGCTQEHAEAITWEVHSSGSAVCYTGPLERCEHIAVILEQINLLVKMEQ